MKKLLELTTKDFLTGLSSGWHINDGLFRELKGVDILQRKKYYGVLKPSYDMTDITSTVIEDQIKWFVRYTQSGTTRTFAYGDEGYLYRIQTPTDTPEVLDSGNEAGRAGGKGLIVYQGLLHYFGNTNVGTYNFDSTYTADVYTGLQDSIHSAKVIDDKIIFANGKYVGTITDTTLNATRLEFSSDYTVQDIDEYNGYAVILMSNGFHSLIYLWDTYSDYCTYKYEVYEDCTALEKYIGTFAVFGDNFHLFNGGDFDALYQISDKPAPGATAYRQNMLYYVDGSKIYTYGKTAKGIKPKIMSPYSLGIKTSDAIFPWLRSDVDYR